MSIVKTPDREGFVIREIEQFNSFILNDDVRKAKYALMRKDPFSFFRGTAHLFYKDLNLGTIPVPADWESTPSIKTWIQGDFHLKKVGFFENNKGDLIFDLNNYDEAYIAPFYWDLIRFVTALFLIKDDLGFECDSRHYSALTEYFLATYQDVLEQGVNNDLDEEYLTGGIKDKMILLGKEHSKSAFLERWTTLKGEKQVFNLDLPELSAPTDEERGDITSNWSIYLSSVYKQISEANGDYFTIKDIARYGESDIESMGTDRFYILIHGEGEGEDKIVLEAKQQRLPGMFYTRHISRPRYYSFFASHAGRCLTACKALLKNADDHFGLLIGQNASYFVKKVSPYNWSFSPRDFTDEKLFKDFLKYSAYALAQGHNRSDKHYDETYIPYKFEDAALNALGNWEDPISKIVELGKWYSQQVIIDFGLFSEHPGIFD